MRCEKCGQETTEVSRLRGETQFICRPCRLEKGRLAKEQPAAEPVPSR